MLKNLSLQTLFSIYLLFYYSDLAASEAPIILPGAPGEESKNLDAEDATNIANTSYIVADVKFLQGMIVHHEQAILMSSMVGKRTNNPTIVDLADRIDASQEDEISFMEGWLKDRDENVPEENEHSMMDNHKMDHDGMEYHDMSMHLDMVGMANPKQLKELENSKSTDFDRLFLQLMIAHHDGALEMVKDLKKFSGAAYDPILNEFISDLVNDQGVEIERMNTIAVGLSDDPRSGLAHGLYTADEAILNLELIASLRKPTGFYDPTNPTGKGSEDLTEDNEGKTTAEISRSLRSVSYTHLRAHET